MAGTGMSSGPSPWWQQPGQGERRSNLETQAPPGYQYDPVKMEYVKTGAEIGNYAGDALNALKAKVPGMFGPSTSSMTGSGGPGGAGGGAAAGVQLGGMGGTPQAHIAGPDNTEANAAEFARAKDRVGEIGRGALTGLRSSMGSRNMMGSGIEGKQTADVIQSGQGQLGEVVRDQAITNSNQDNANAVTGYQGDITQRGQDQNAAATEYQGKITQRGQDMNAAAQQQQFAIQQQAQQQQQLDRLLSSLKLQMY